MLTDSITRHQKKSVDYSIYVWVMTYFDDNSYLFVFSGLLVLIMAVVQIYFLNSVTKFNGTELLKHNLINVARVDPSMRDTVVNAYNNCNQGPVHDLEAKLATASGVGAIVKNIGAPAILAALAGGVLVMWLVQAYRRYKGGIGILGFKRGAVMREIWPLSLLLIPCIVEAIVFVFCYSRFRYFTNISLVRLVKTVRLQQEMKFLKDNQLAPGDIDPTKPCFSNCLSLADRQVLLTDLDKRIQEYDIKVADMMRSSTPSIFGRMKAMQGITGIVLACIVTVGCLALLSLLTMYHKTMLPACVVIVGLMITFLLMFVGQIGHSELKTAASPEFNSASASVLFCDSANPLDPFSKMSKKNSYRAENNAIYV